MEQVLNLGRYTATLIAKDFANWLQERTYIEKGRSELSQRYAGLCNERWGNYLSLRGQKQRTIGQKLLAALQGVYKFVLHKLFLLFYPTYKYADGDEDQKKQLKVNSMRKSRSAVCVCAMILALDGSKLRLTHPNMWSPDIQKRIGLLRKKERTEYSTGVAKKRGAKVTKSLSHPMR